MTTFSIKGKPIVPAGGSNHMWTENAHSVAGHPNKYIATYGHDRSGDPVIRKHSPYVTAWLKTLPDPQLSDDDAQLAARLSSLPAPSWAAPLEAYRTHAQRMAELYRAADKANAKKPPVVWRPITAERRQQLLLNCRTCGKECGKRHAGPEWPPASRERSIAVATKRGDIFQLESEQ